METVKEVVDSTAAQKVFGSPISQDGITVVPVAKVSGGGGGGGGVDGKGESGGEGGGVGVSAKPLGVFVIKDGKVGWRPAIDINKVIIGGQIVAVVALLVIRAVLKARARHEDE
ncbi:spore germination protein GerW family protein [Rhizocola hellebori]|nr:spore germination protein GerW family protein [Rhizocola hellebori]